MEIITAPPIPLCTFYCQFSNRKTAAEKKEGHKLYGALPPGLASSRERASSIPPLPSLSFPLSFLRLTANFSSLFRSDGTQESTLRRRRCRRRRRQTNFRRWLSGTAGRSTDTSLAQNGNNSHRRRRQCFQDGRTDGRHFLPFSALR